MQDITGNIEMTVTKWLMDKDPSLELHSEAEFSGSSAQDYSAFNDGGIEAETGEFIFGLIRMLKPKTILETGTHLGVGAAYMGAACMANGFGEVHTLEFLPENHMRAKQRIKDIGLERYVVTVLMDVAEYQPDDRYDLILLDTEPQTRFAELLQFYNNLNEGGLLLIHDLPRSMCQGNINPDHPDEPSWPFGNIPDKIKEWVKQGKLRPMSFSTPRGLYLFYKTHKDDFVWTSKDIK